MSWRSDAPVLSRQSIAVPTRRYASFGQRSSDAGTAATKSTELYAELPGHGVKPIVTALDGQDQSAG